MTIKSFVACLVLMFSINFVVLSQDVAIQNTKVESKVNPIGLDITHPRFSWQISSSLFNVMQMAYQIKVGTSEKDLGNDANLLWNSGKVEGGISVLIPYNGKDLESLRKYYWQVKVWTNKGETKWSSTNSFTTAYLTNPLPKAKWIGIDSTMQSGPLTTKTRLSARYLRKEFDSEKQKIKDATLYISGLGLYECFINGKKINNDVFAPTATDYSKTVPYNTIDVTKFIQKKQNTIGVVLGNGRYFSMRMADVVNGEPLTVPAVTHYGYPKLLLQMNITYQDGTTKTINSDDSWRLTTKGPIVANNEFDGEEYDANLEMTGWDKNGFNDSQWMFAKNVGTPEGKLTAQLNPNIATMKILRPISIKAMGGKKFVVDMGQNMVGWLAVKLKGYKNQPIKLRFTETLKPDGNVYTANLRGAEITDTYIPSKDGDFCWEPKFTYHGFRYVEITGTDEMPLAENLAGKVNYDYMENTGTFTTSDSTLNQIYHNAKWGIMGNYRSMPTDCPQRDERMGWLGDRATGCFGESFMFDNQLLYRKWEQDIHDAQKPSGSIPDVAPAHWSVYSDNITWPGTYIHVANMLYEQFGDDKPIKLHYASMKLWMKYMQDNYMKNYIMTKDTYGDWCMPPETLDIIFSKDPARITDGEIISTTFYYRLLNIMAKYATMTRNNADNTEFLALAGKVKTAYNDKFFDKNKAQYGNNTVTANIISLMQGLVPDEFEERVFTNLAGRTETEFNSHVSVGLIGIQFLMRGLTEYGREDLALKIATNRTYPSWGYMIENGATTIWELWNGNTADPAMNSGNHVMLLGDLLPWYYENLAGIRTDKSEVGFKKVILKPSFPKGLNAVTSSHESPYGLIKSEWKRENNKLYWSVTVPSNSSAEIQLPLSVEKTLKVSGAGISGNKYLTELSTSADILRLNAVSGNYSFEMEY